MSRFFFTNIDLKIHEVFYLKNLISADSAMSILVVSRYWLSCCMRGSDLFLENNPLRRHIFIILPHFTFTLLGWNKAK